MTLEPESEIASPRGQSNLAPDGRRLTRTNSITSMVSECQSHISESPLFPFISSHRPESVNSVYARVAGYGAGMPGGSPFHRGSNLSRLQNYSNYTQLLESDEKEEIEDAEPVATKNPVTPSPSMVSNFGNISHVSSVKKSSKDDDTGFTPNNDSGIQTAFTMNSSLTTPGTSYLNTLPSLDQSTSTIQLDGQLTQLPQQQPASKTHPKAANDNKFNQILQEHTHLIKDHANLRYQYDLKCEEVKILKDTLQERDNSIINWKLKNSQLSSQIARISEESGGEHHFPSPHDSTGLRSRSAVSVTGLDNLMSPLKGKNDESSVFYSDENSKSVSVEKAKNTQKSNQKPKKTPKLIPHPKNSGLAILQPSKSSKILSALEVKNLHQQANNKLHKSINSCPNLMSKANSYTTTGLTNNSLTTIAENVGEEDENDGEGEEGEMYDSYDMHQLGVQNLKIKMKNQHDKQKKLSRNKKNLKISSLQRSRSKSESDLSDTSSSSPNATSNRRPKFLKDSLKELSNDSFVFGRPGSPNRNSLEKTLKRLENFNASGKNYESVGNLLYRRQMDKKKSKSSRLKSSRTWNGENLQEYGLSKSSSYNGLMLVKPVVGSTMLRIWEFLEELCFFPLNS